MTQFRHVPDLPLVELEVSSDERGRTYTTPDGNTYPSVTTVLGATGDSTWLDEWRARVGHEAAERIVHQAGVRGDAVHDLAEKYLRNDPAYTKGHMPVNIFTFNQLKPILDEHVGLIAALEVPLYSDFLRVAGRVDCIAKWDGIWSVIDFKTSRIVKTEEHVQGYKMQESCYGYMFYERYGLVIPQIVTVMAIDGNEPKVFIDKVSNHLHKFIERRNKF